MVFSIIIPIYNAEKSLTRCLESIRCQYCADYEVIMVNDGSTDGSENICKYYTSIDKRFHYFVQANQGVSAARNYGIIQAKGHFIAFLDSDDEFEPDYLENFEILINKYPDYDNYWCGFKNVNSYDNRFEIHNFDTEAVSFCTRNEIMTLHEKWMDSTLWNKIFKRDIVLKNNIEMDSNLSLGEDILFVYQYLSVTDNKIIILNKPLYRYYFEGTNSLDTKYRSDIKDIYDFIDSKIFEYLETWKISETQMKKYYNSVYFSQEKILHNTFREEAKLSICQRYKYNNEIIRSKKFVEALKKSDCFIHPLYRLAYKSKYYCCVRALDLLVRIKKKLL